MTQKKDLNEFINEINEKLTAVLCIQKIIVALIVAKSPNNRKIIRDAIAKTLEHISDEEFNAKTLQNELKKYIAFIDHGPPKDPRDIFRVILGGQDNKSQ